MSEKPRLDTTRLQKIAQAYWESAALMAAVELEIFTAIAHGHDTIATAAKAAGISERNAERLLTALTAMTLLTREGDGEQGRFANAPDVQRFLVKDGERYAGPWILFTKPRWTAYGELSQRLRSTRRPLSRLLPTSGRPDCAAKFMRPPPGRRPTPRADVQSACSSCRPYRRIARLT